MREEGAAPLSCVTASITITPSSNPRNSTDTGRYENEGKKVVTYELRSEALYRLVSKQGQQVSFRLPNGRVSGLHLK